MNLSLRIPLTQFQEGLVQQAVGAKKQIGNPRQEF